jgi:error-prone DNA polymerase
VICSPGLWTRYRRVARSSPALLVRGRLERTPTRNPEDPVALNLVAERIEPLPLGPAARSRDFR